MINSQFILKSTKKSGKYEDVIISQLESYFTLLGYETIPHARFDIAWGSIISDVDLLLIKDNRLAIVEVKSSRDKLMRAKDQIKEVEDFVDRIYIATDYHPRKWPRGNAGRIVVCNGKVTILKEAKSLERLPRFRTLLSLRKDSLSRLLGLSENEAKNLDKFELATRAMERNSPELKSQLKEVITCQQCFQYTGSKIIRKR